MSSKSKSVIVEVYSGSKATVPWKKSMTALQALEKAPEIIEPDPNEQFTFALQYFTSCSSYG